MAHDFSDRQAIIDDLNAKVATLQAERDRAAEALRRLVAKVADLQRELDTARNTERYRRRPPVLRGRTVQTNVGCGPLYVTLNEDEAGRPFELFFKLGKSGSCQQSYLEALGVAMSVGLRYGADPQKFIDKFAGMRCPNPTARNGEGPGTLSCADGISQGLAKALEVVIRETRAPTQLNDVQEPQGPDVFLPTVSASNTVAAKQNGFGAGLCPRCNGNLVIEGGFERCGSCGYTGKAR